MKTPKASWALRTTVALMAAGCLLAGCEKDMNMDGAAALDAEGTYATAAVYGWGDHYARVALDERRPNNDVALLIRVKSALVAEPGLKPFALDAGVLDGVVTLYGEVDSSEHRAMAERITRQVQGVAEVNSGIAVIRRG
ncbi:MAG: BON domain-containing protein [Betaproteobacteria bacterium]